MLQLSTLLLRKLCRLSVKKIKILRQIILHRNQVGLVLMKNKQILGYYIKILQLSGPYCRESKIQHPWKLSGRDP